MWNYSHQFWIGSLKLFSPEFKIITPDFLNSFSLHWCRWYTKWSTGRYKTADRLVCLGYILHIKDHWLNPCEDKKFIQFFKEFQHLISLDFTPVYCGAALVKKKCQLTEIHFPYMPVDHWKFQCSSQDKEDGEKSINTKVFLSRPPIQEPPQSATVKFHLLSCKWIFTNINTCIIKVLVWSTIWFCFLLGICTLDEVGKHQCVMRTENGK